MEISELIKQKIPQELWELANKFIIPESFFNEDPNLIILILSSKSIDKLEEKQSWFNLLSIMNKEQIDRLRDILLREKEKLAEIDKKYENTFHAVNYEKTLDQLQENENKNKEQDSQEAEKLLTNI